MGVTPIKFGTDGWRAVIAEEYTFENVRACAQGVAAYLKANGLADRGLVVGYDTRFASEDFAQAAAETAAAHGVDVALCDRACPTPAVSYNVLARKAGGGIVITASHNPGRWNGFKYKPDYGGSASPEVVEELEAHIAEAQRGGSGTGSAKGTVTTFDSIGPYLEQLSTRADLDAIRQSGFDVVVDSMHGVGAGLTAQLAGGGKTRVTELRAERNPAFPGMAQPEPIAHNLAPLTAAVAGSDAAVGLATDGDADRLGLVDEHGVFVTQLQTLALLALYLLEVRGERGALVKSITTTNMLYRLGEIYDAPVFETPVGFKHLGPVMLRENALIAGEESGGYGFRGHVPERDGILSGLYILSMMAALGKKPAELIEYLYEKVGPHHYDRIDLTFDAAEKDAALARLESAAPKALGGTEVSSIDKRDGFRFLLADGSWSLVRFSGTEPLMRVYCETSSPARVRELLAETRSLTGI